MKILHTRYAVYVILTLICVGLLGMIYIGANGLALAPRKSVFVFKMGSKLITDPGYYLKGVTDPNRVHMDLSKVNMAKPKTYTVQVKQSNQNYTFKIKVTE